MGKRDVSKVMFQGHEFTMTCSAIKIYQQNPSLRAFSAA